MRILRSDLDAAVTGGMLTAEQANGLWAFLEQRAGTSPRFTFVHILYYFGGMIAIGAMTLFMTLAWSRYGGWGLFFIAVCYSVLGLIATRALMRRELAIPAGITATFVLALVPLAIFGVQEAMGWRSSQYFYRDYHYYIDWNWLMMEYGTLAAGAIMLWRYRLPFLVMPVAVTLWYMSMDIVPFLSASGDYDWQLRKLVSVYFGIVMTLIAFWIDVRNRTRLDFSFWLYLFGVGTFWGGLTSMHSDSEINKLIYCLINLGMIAIGAILNRRVFAVFGGLGVASYLGYLSWQVFRDSMLFPFALTALGFGIVYCGILWQRHEQRLSHALRAVLPGAVRELVERRA
jgi:hypothetical protein